MNSRFPSLVLFFAILVALAACSHRERPIQINIDEAKDIHNCVVGVEVHYDLAELTESEARKVFRGYEESLVDDVRKASYSLDIQIWTYLSDNKRMGPDAYLELGAWRTCSEGYFGVKNVMREVARRHNIARPEHKMTFTIFVSKSEMIDPRPNDKEYPTIQEEGR